MLVGRIFKGNYFSLPPPPIFHKLIFFAFCTRETIPCPITDLEELITEEEVEHYSLKVYAARYFGKQDARGKAVPVHQLVKFSSVKPPLPFSLSTHLLYSQKPLTSALTQGAGEHSKLAVEVSRQILVWMTAGTSAARGFILYYVRRVLLFAFASPLLLLTSFLLSGPRCPGVAR